MNKKALFLILAAIIASLAAFSACDGKNDSSGGKKYKENKYYVTLEISSTESEPADVASEINRLLRKRMNRAGFNKAAIVFLSETKVRVEMPATGDDVFLLFSTGNLLFKDGNDKIWLTDECVTEASTGESDGNYFVNLKLSDDGKTAFSKATEDISVNPEDKHLYIYLDDRMVRSSLVTEGMNVPVVSIGEFKTRESAERFLISFSGEKLPARLTIIEKGELEKV